MKRITSNRAGWMVGVSMLMAVVGFPAHADEKATAMIEAMVAEVGSMEQLYARRDVVYSYFVRQGATGQVDLSVEHYMFDGELSYATYDLHESSDVAEPGDTLVQGYDGEQAWLTVNGQRVTEEEAVHAAWFSRTTNYYWFAMMPKLLDPGAIHTYKGTREHAGVTYDLVEVGFETDQPSDTYLLYINPETKLVDRFLFTVVDFGRTDPLLMEVEYAEVDGLLLPAKRRFTPATGWDGGVPDDAVWTDEIMTHIRFDNGLDRDMFDPPGG